MEWLRQVRHYYRTNGTGVERFSSYMGARIEFLVPLAGVERQFHPVDGEHEPADQAFPVAKSEDLGEEALGLRPQPGDEGGQVG